VRNQNIQRARGEQAASAEVLQMVAFSVGEAEYALDIMRIKEIIHPVPVRAVPKAPYFIEGVIELRGSILPIIDVRKRFDVEATPATRTTKFLIVGLDVGEKRMIAGLIVDRVSEPLRVARDQIRPAPQLAQGEGAYFTGVVHHQGRILMLLDVDSLLSASERSMMSGLSQPKETK
jgi:purine-binding chemotaxis protein CheW